VRREEEPRLPDEKEVEWIRRAEEDWRRRVEERKEEGSGRGQQQLLLIEEKPHLRDADALLHAAKRAALKTGEIAHRMEQGLRRMKFTELYDELRKTLDAYNRGEIDVDTAKTLIADITKKMENVERDLKAKIKSRVEALRPKTDDILLSKMREIASRVEDSAVRIELARRYGEIRVRLNDLLYVLDAYRQGRISPDAAKQQIAYIIRKIEKEDRDVAEIVRNKLPDAVRPSETTTAEIQQLLMPEIRSALVEGMETRQRLKEADVALTSPMTSAAAAVRLRKPELLYAVSTREVEKPKRRRLIIPLMPPIMQAETPQYTEPWTKTPESFGDVLKYNLPLLTPLTTPPTADVPPTPTYTPISVPQISEVPTVDVPTMPTYDAYPMPQPEPLPSGWWRFLPPSMFTEGAKEGAYNVQSGKKQILALA
jgi:polyhydroxyalkanoate synthesis regulator phasin